MGVYTEEQLAKLRARAEDMAVDALARGRISDPGGERLESMAEYFFERREEWAALVDL